MEVKKILSLILVILMALPLIPLTPVKAESPKIETSADPHGGYFTNETWIEVKVTDTARAGSDNVTVNMYKNGVIQDSIVLKEVGSSGVFVAYVIFNSTNVGYVPENPLEEQFLYNGTDFSVTLAEDDEITFEYIGPGGTVTAKITYKPFKAQVLLDREYVPAFGEAKIYVTIHDQDYNKDPTKAESISYELNFTLVDKLGNVYKVASSTLTVTLNETKANSAHFKGSITLDQIFTQLGYTGAMEYYNTTTDYMGNTYKWVNFTTIKNNTIPFDHIEIISEDDTSAKVYLQRTNGLISLPATVSLATELTIEVNDADANLDTEAKDTLYVNVTLTDFTGTPNNMIVELTETDVDTGVFKGKVYLTYDDAEHADTADKVFYVNKTRTILVEYYDPSADDIVAARDVTMTDYDPELTVEPTQTLPTEKVTLTLTDMDLNDKGDDVADSFGQSVSRGQRLEIDFANNKQGYLEVLLNGKAVFNASTNFFIFFEEVEPGVFQATFDLTWLNETPTEGDTVVFKWVDVYTNKTAKATVTISKPEITVSLDRDVYPMPSDGQFKVYVTVNNPYANANPGLKDTIPADDLTVKIILWNKTEKDSTSPYLTALGDLVETDVDSGVFVGSFTVDITDNPKTAIAFVGAVINVTYGTYGSATATIRPSTATLTINATSFSMGDHIYITLVEPDENIDSAEEDNVDVTLDGDITGTVTLKETGANTGIFEGVFRIGVDDPFNITTPHKDFELSYYDKYTALTSVTYQRDKTVKVSGTVVSHDSEFYIGSLEGDIESVGPHSIVKIYVKDPDYIITWEKGDNLNLTDNEIFVRSSIFDELKISSLQPAEEEATFEATIQLNYTDTADTRNDNLEVTVPDNIIFRFIDPVAADGKSNVEVKWLKVIAWDGNVTVEPQKEFYNDKEDIIVKVVDPDQNVDPDRQDSVNVTITSWRVVGGELQPVDPAGFVLELIETDVDTGVFVAPYTIDSDSFKPYFEIGDKLKITYKDPTAADGKEKVTSEVMLQIGFTTATPVSPGAPDEVDVVDITGNPVTPKAGTPILLQVPVSNVDTTRSVTVDIILVAYQNGVPASISTSRITLNAGESTVANVPWLPTAPGEYEVKIFFWNLAEKTPLSEEPLQLTITVTE